MQQVLSVLLNEIIIGSSKITILTNKDVTLVYC